jgi:hypothetical protein
MGAGMSSEPMTVHDAAVAALDSRLVRFAPIELQLAELEDLAVQDSLTSSVRYDITWMVAACVVAERRLMLAHGMDQPTAEQLSRRLAQTIAGRLKEAWD